MTETHVTWADYARAEQFLPWNATKRIFNAEMRPNWIGGGGRLWYRRTGRDEATFLVVDPASDVRQPAFDHVRLAASLSLAAGTPFVHTRLPFETFAFTDGERAIQLYAADKQWTCDLTTYECTPSEKDETPKDEVRSPDGKWAAFMRDHNLVVREVATGAEGQVTTDGGPDNA